MLNITLSDLASFPILTYMLGLSGRSQLDKTFQQANLTPRIAFTATDSDVIKTYVRLGLGAGIIAEMACDKNDQELVYIDANHLFPDSLIKIGFRHSRHISSFQFVFLQMIAPYLEMDTIKEIAATRTRAEQEELLVDYQVPSFKAMQKTKGIH
jgi:LysR family cys regulon transcriptional activator